MFGLLRYLFFNSWPISFLLAQWRSVNKVSAFGTENIAGALLGAELYSIAMLSFSEWSLSVLIKFG